MTLSSFLESTHCDSPDSSDDTLPPDSLAAWQLYDWSWLVIGVCTAAAVGISLSQIIAHVQHYHRPNLQRYVVRILFIIPIYAVDSFISFKFIYLSVFIGALRDCYEGFVIYNFFCLLIQMLGGNLNAKLVFSTKPVQKLPFPLLCCSVKPTRRTLRVLRQLILQYVYIRPISAAIACTMHALGSFCPGNLSGHHGFLYVSVMNSISVSIAVYALVTFYVITREELEEFNPLRKFFAIKSVVFIMFWQSVLIAVLVRCGVLHGIGAFTTDNVRTGLQNGLVCIEMFFMAIYHAWAFNVNEYKIASFGDSSKRYSMMNVLNVSDIWKDTMTSFVMKSSSGGREISPLLSPGSPNV